MNRPHSWIASRHVAERVAALLLTGVVSAPAEELPLLQNYARPGQLAPLPEGTASLYRVPWRSSVRSVSAAAALEGIGLYYKHIPSDWSEAENVSVMRQLAEVGVRRLRLAPHYAIHINAEWKAPREQELLMLRRELRACKAAGIRPCVLFVHIPPVGKAGTRELQEWWRQGELMPSGAVGSLEFKAYLDKTYEALLFLLREARDAGFVEPDSYDLELAQGIWWGAPSVTAPLPDTILADLRPGGRIYEFDRGLILRLREDGFQEPSVWWGITHHHFEHATDDEVPPEAAGRSISFYGAWTGHTAERWLDGVMHDGSKNPNGVWPVRAPLRFLEGDAPPMVLARPEGWMADRSRRDNLIELLRSSRTPVAITALGTVPSDIPDAGAGGLNGWQIKQRGLTRSLAFWLNQGAPFVLLHSAYEPGAGQRSEGDHSLIPSPIEPGAFRWHHSPPLVTLRSFGEGLSGAVPLLQLTPLSFRFALNPDPVLIPASGDSGPLKASDALALLTYQITETEFSVAAYVVSPNIAIPCRP